ncbi:hypothetical protein FXO37_10167 [Capsicum annuum]|nr:hypothetical protein FXO37_10167 [Capsicum annuum]
MAMARDGLLPSFFSDISKHTQVPVKGTIATGIFIAILAFVMDVSQLAGMVSVGTLLSFTVVALSILILRYVPPDELHYLPSDQQSNVGQHLDALGTDMAERPLLQKDIAQGMHSYHRISQPLSLRVADASQPYRSGCITGLCEMRADASASC